MIMDEIVKKWIEQEKALMLPKGQELNDRFLDLINEKGTDGACWLEMPLDFHSWGWNQECVHPATPMDIVLDGIEPAGLIIYGVADLDGLAVLILSQDRLCFDEDGNTFDEPRAYISYFHFLPEQIAQIAKGFGMEVMEEDLKHAFKRPVPFVPIEISGPSLLSQLDVDGLKSELETLKVAQQGDEISARESEIRQLLISALAQQIDSQKSRRVELKGEYSYWGAYDDPNHVSITLGHRYCQHGTIYDHSGLCEGTDEVMCMAGVMDIDYCPFVSFSQEDTATLLMFAQNLKG